jgi:uncharacterized delta-60 repeat protein
MLMAMRHALLVSSLAFALIIPFVACVGDDVAPSAAGPADDAGMTGPDGSTGDTGVAGSATVKVDRARRWVPQAGTATVQATIARTNETGALTLRAKDLPAGVTAADVVIPADQSTATFTFTAAAAAALGKETTTTIELYDGATKLGAAALTIGVSGQPGTLDGTFGATGTVHLTTTMFGGAAAGTSVAGDVAVYPPSSPHAGKIIVTGKTVIATKETMVVARLDANGALDPTFGDAAAGGARKGFALGPGFVPPTGTLTEYLRVSRVAIDSMDRVLFLANRFTMSSCLVHVLRFTADGAVDPTFKAFATGLEAQSCGDAQELLVGAGDAPVVLGTWNFGVKQRHTVIQAFAADGTPALPITVDVPGVKLTQLYRMRFDAQLRYVLAGNTCDTELTNPMPVCKAALVRVTAGTLDPAFGTAGKTYFDFGGTATTDGYGQAFYGLTSTPDGAFVAVGGNNQLVTSAFASVGTDGGPETKLGPAGMLTRQLVPGSDVEAQYEALIDDEGRLISVGYSSVAGALSLIVTRTSRTGAADNAYGTNGLTTVPAIQIPTYGPRAKLMNDGRLVVVRDVLDPAALAMATWRFWP